MINSVIIQCVCCLRQLASVAQTPFADELHHVYDALQHLSPLADLLSVNWHLRSHEKVLNSLFRGPKEVCLSTISVIITLLMLINSKVYVCEVGHASDEGAAISRIRKSHAKKAEECLFVFIVWCHFLCVPSLRKNALCTIGLSAFCWGWKCRKRSNARIEDEWMNDWMNKLAMFDSIISSSQWRIGWFSAKY